MAGPIAKGGSPKRPREQTLKPLREATAQPISNFMEQIDQYKGYTIRAFEQRPGSWLAEIRKQDGSIILRKGQRPREILTTPATRYSAAEAIAFAKEAIDSPAMHGKTLTPDQARRIANNMMQLTDVLKRGK
jgi:hypothetical protein